MLSWVVFTMGEEKGSLPTERRKKREGSVRDILWAPAVAGEKREGRRHRLFLREKKRKLDRAEIIGESGGEEGERPKSRVQLLGT